MLLQAKYFYILICFSVALFIIPLIIYQKLARPLTGVKSILEVISNIESNSNLEDTTILNSFSKMVDNLKLENSTNVEAKSRLKANLFLEANSNMDTNSKLGSNLDLEANSQLSARIDINENIDGDNNDGDALKDKPLKLINRKEIFKKYANKKKIGLKFKVTESNKTFVLGKPTDKLILNYEGRNL